MNERTVFFLLMIFGVFGSSHGAHSTASTASDDPSQLQLMSQPAISDASAADGDFRNASPAAEEDTSCGICCV